MVTVTCGGTLKNEGAGEGRRCRVPVLKVPITAPFFE